MLPWYLRPIEPSRVVPLRFWHCLPSVLVLAFFVSVVAFLGTPTPDVSPQHGFGFPPIMVWAALAAVVVRRRQSGRSPVSIPGATLSAIAATVLAVPGMLWPHWSDAAPVTSVVASTSLICWLSAGVLFAIGLYLIVSDAFSASGARAA